MLIHLFPRNCFDLKDVALVLTIPQQQVDNNENHYALYTLEIFKLTK